MRNLITLAESLIPPEPLPPDVVKAFQHLGDAQRDKPEMAMLRVQQAIGGGVLSMAVEHVGDITHRMSHLAGRNYVMGREKVIKALLWLNHPYGFEREARENLVSNARYRDIPLDQFKRKATIVLRAYAAAHAQLPVYNRAQWLARQAAVSLGLEEFNHARDCLQQLSDLASSDEEFTRNALQYSRDQDGNLVQYVKVP